MERETVGYLFDYILVLRCYRIWEELENNLDHFIVCSGREGRGKSTLSIQIASWIYPQFNLSHICYDAATFVGLLRLRAKGLQTTPEDVKCIVMDEGTELLGREFQHLTNRVLTKSFFIQRALKFLVIINIPNFFMLDKVVRQHRVRTLIYVKKRGLYKCITGKGIDSVAEYGFRREISEIKLKQEDWWTGYFNKDFPSNVSREEYEGNKMEKIREALDKMKEDLTETKMISSSKVSKQIDMSQATMINLIRAGEIEGKQIGGKFYITKRAYEKLISKPIKEEGE